MNFAVWIVALCFSLPAFGASTADEKSDEALVAAAEQLIAEGDSAKKVEPPAEPKVEKAEPKESEIPIVMSEKKATEEKGGAIWRMVASLAVIAVTAAGVLFASKRWARRKDIGGAKARIEMMHQYHLGPRKSIGLIRVAGETLLIGITEQNINMLKPVTLIDDELEHIANKDFNNFLEDEFSIEDVRNALSPRV